MANASGSGSSKPLPPSVTRQIFDTDLIQQSSAYLPGAAQEMARTGKHRPPGKRETVIRKGNGKTWEDPTLLDWDPSEFSSHGYGDRDLIGDWILGSYLEWFRLFVGDVSNDVNERTLDSAFDKYPSYCKCKVVRDRLSEKVGHQVKYSVHRGLCRGARSCKRLQLVRPNMDSSRSKTPKTFSKLGRRWMVIRGFSVHSSPLTHLSGKYVGNRPIRLSKVKDDQYGSIGTVQVSGRKVSRFALQSSLLNLIHHRLVSSTS